MFVPNRCTIDNHLIVRGIVRDYNPWVHNGEREEQASSTDDDTDDELLYKGDGLFAYDIPENDANNTATEKGSNELPKKFSKLVENAEPTFYLGCKTFTRLEFLITLLHIKVSWKWSDKSFSMLL